jgi:hypothetical protein
VVVLEEGILDKEIQVLTQMADLVVVVQVTHLQDFLKAPVEHMVMMVELVKVVVLAVVVEVVVLDLLVSLVEHLVVDMVVKALNFLPHSMIQTMV